MFIALVGPDGAGKTTVARALERLATTQGRRFAYVHWIPSARNSPPPAVPLPAGPPPSKLAPVEVTRARQVASAARLARNLIRFWIGYLLGMRRHLGDVRGNDCVVVADRWIYNYAAQPHSVAYVGSGRLARLAIRLAPRPDLTVLLDAPAEIVVARKDELSIEEARAEIQRWRRLDCPNKLVAIDATAGPEALAAQILSMAEAA